MDNWGYFEKRYGTEIGRGAQCRVYRSEDTAYKVLTEGHLLIDALRECYSLAAVDEIGVPINNLSGVYRDAGQIVIATRYVAGNELIDSVVSCVERGDEVALAKHLGSMADLALRINEVDGARLGLPRSKDNLGLYFKTKYLGGDASRARLLALLDGLPDGDRLCHNDLHLKNVLFDGAAYTVIDWDSATAGDPAGDVAHSYVITFMASRELGDDLAERYLNIYLEKSGIERERVRRWIPLHAALTYDVLKSTGNPAADYLPLLCEAYL